MWLTEHLTKHCDLKNKKILDWGCGPGRIIRHLPNVIGNGCNYYATDYNKKSVEWCSANLPGINFNQNTIDAKLPYEDNFFDVIYGISVFTHLSLQQHYEWYKELFRVLNDGGIFFFTTQGENFKGKLTNKELNKFEKGELVVRGNVKEGHRTFSAFHSIKFMQHLFSNVAILAHVRPAVENEEAPSQDIWIARKISTYNNK
jgi:ubiquinone/menaquinone biosynthesis C-methylase UbiE